MALLSCQGFTRRPWFENRELELEAGSIRVVFGESGSGKTLFLRSIADLDPADAGTASIGGRKREDLPPHAWRAAVLYVHPGGVRLEGSVRDNLAAVLELKAREAKPALESVKVLGLTHGSDAALLSSGESQSLALERALICNPQVLLLDEPTANLDERAARRWENRLQAWVKEEGTERAILWVSHDKTLAERVGAELELFP